MPVSEARLAANRANAARSTGPKTPEGKAASRRNGLKHGLTGEGVVVPEGDAEEIARRVEDLTADLAPRSPLGALMIRQMATLSVRSERAAERENAAIAERVRHAADDFDEARIDRANALFDALHEDPRGNLRRLRKSPEGVDRLLDGWRDLRDDLAREGKGSWTAAHLEQAALMTGVRSENARTTRLGALSNGVWGDFWALGESDGGDLEEEDRRKWARARLIEWVDVEIAALEAHRETLDFATIELDRREAPTRALFDPSREATLARRYEAAAHRGFFKAIQEFRRAEAESAARAESNPGRPTAPNPVDPAARLGSSRPTPPPPAGHPSPAFPDLPSVEDSVVRGADGQPSRVARPTKTPG